MSRFYYSEVFSADRLYYGLCGSASEYFIFRNNQDFSIAGKRRGFDDTRGTLFFEIARIAAVKKPKYMLLENVPGLWFELCSNRA